MGEVRSFRCDLCDAEKKCANHWWILCATSDSSVSAITCTEFSEETWQGLKSMTSQTVVLACGEGHAQQLFDRWLRNRSFS